MIKRIISLLVVLSLSFVMCGCEENEAVDEELHVWEAATCTTPRRCMKCGKTDGEPLGHDWEDATCLAPKTCRRCGKTEGEVSDHTWISASSTAPKTCSVCGKVKCEANEHKWIEATCNAPKTCSVCGEVEGEALEHVWSEATCTEARVCSLCGARDGEPLGHDVSGLTCTKDGKCSRCGEVIPATGHTWIAATCTESKKCSVCGEKEGEPLGHTTTSGICERCGLEYYEPITGKGDDVISNVTVGDGLYRAHINYSGKDYFSVKVYDEDGNYQTLLANSIGKYDGYVLLTDEAPFTFVVKATGKWSIQIEKISKDNKTSFSGSGDYVTMMFSSSVKKWHITYKGDDYFSVKSYCTDGRDLLVSNIGSYDGNVLFSIPSDSLALFEIHAEGEWTIEPA